LAALFDFGFLILDFGLIEHFVTLSSNEVDSNFTDFVGSCCFDCVSLPETVASRMADLADVSADAADGQSAGKTTSEKKRKSERSSARAL
jgi:hypothetical protein